METSLNLPGWTRSYTALSAALQSAWESAGTDAARAALQRILDYPKVEASLSPLLPDGCSNKRQRWVADFLRAAACAVDTPYEKMQAARKHMHENAKAVAASIQGDGTISAAAAIKAAFEIMDNDTLFAGPPPLKRPGNVEKTRMRYARSMLCHATASELGEPPYALIEKLLNAVFKPDKPTTPDSVRKFWEAEQGRLGRK